MSCFRREANPEVESDTRHMRTLITLAASAFLVAGCASGGSPGASSHPSTSRYVVTEQELTDNGDRSVYEVLQMLHATFLRTRDPATVNHPNPEPVSVYIDGSPTEGVEALKRIRASTVKEIRFYEPSEANARYGSGHDGGLIAVTMK